MAEMRPAMPFASKVVKGKKSTSSKPKPKSTKKTSKGR